MKLEDQQPKVAAITKINARMKVLNDSFKPQYERLKEIRSQKKRFC